MPQLRSEDGWKGCGMSNIVDISANEPHLVCEVIDLKCHHRWIAVYPEKTLLKELECPNCGAVGFVIKTGQEIDGGDING